MRSWGFIPEQVEMYDVLAKGHRLRSRLLGRSNRLAARIAFRSNARGALHRHVAGIGAAKTSSVLVSHLPQFGPDS